MPSLIIRASTAVGIFDTGSGGSSLTASLSASRTSGPAPLAVLFDATGTSTTDGTLTDTFKDVGYSFNFGDSGAGTWAYSGQSKNVERGGPICAHVFETPGTYTVKMRAVANAGTNQGDNDQTSVTITVTDPNTVYSNTDTVCISRTSDATGAPTGAQVLTNQTSWPTWQSNKRYMLRAGQDFTSFGTVNWFNTQNVHLTKFGSGSDPIVRNIWIEQDDPVGSTFGSARISIYDVDLGESDPYSFEAGKNTEDILLLRANCAGIIGFERNAGYYFNNWSGEGLTTTQRDNIKHCIGTFVVECDYGALSTINASGRNVVCMGNTCDSPTEHSIRIWQAWKCFVAHNLLTNAGSSQHNFKIHSAGTDAYADLLSTTNLALTGQVVFSHNTVGDSSETNDQATCFGPYSGSLSANDGVEDVIVEDNTYVYNWTSGDEICLGGRRMTCRGNTGPGITYQTSYNLAGKPELLEDFDGPYYTDLSTANTLDPV